MGNQDKILSNKRESYFCLVGLKKDISDTCQIPRSSIDLFAKELGVNYVESSAKTNEGIPLVFNPGLFYHYQRYLIKSISPIINNPIPQPEFFHDCAFRQTVLELFKFGNKSIIEYLYSQSFEILVDFFLLDIRGATPEVCNLLEFGTLFFDCKNEIMIKGISDHFNTKGIDKLFDFFFSKAYLTFELPRQYHLVRLLLTLFDYNFPKMARYAQDKGVIEKLLLHSSEESKYQFLTLILQTEKKYHTQHEGVSESCLLKEINLAEHFQRLLTCDPPVISLVESIFKLVNQTQGNNFSGILNTYTYQNYAIPHLLLDLMKNPDTCNDATSLFCDCFLKLHSHTSPEVSA